jgi:hypothetical protein
MIKSEVVAVIKKGNKGIKKIERKYGDDLVCVRYRETKNRKRFITVELIIDEYDLEPKSKKTSKEIISDGEITYLKLSTEEYKKYPELIQLIRENNGGWDKQKYLWEIQNFSKVQPLIKKLNLEDNIQN